MKNLDCNQIKIFIILEIIGEEYKKKNYIFFFLNLKKIAIFTCSNIIYLIYIYIYIDQMNIFYVGLDEEFGL